MNLGCTPKGEIMTVENLTYKPIEYTNIPNCCELEKKHKEFGLCIIDVIRKNYGSDPTPHKEEKGELIWQLQQNR